MSIEEEEDTSLKELVTKALQSNGVLGKIQAELQASVFLALEEEFRDKGIPLTSTPARCLLATQEGAVAASLVQDFLQCLGLDFTLTVFSRESGHPSFWSLTGPEALSSSLGLTASGKEKVTADDKGSGQQIPLLVELLREREILSLSTQQNGDVNSIISNSNGASNRQQQQKHVEGTARNYSELPSRVMESQVEERSGFESSVKVRDHHPPPTCPSLVVENGKNINDIVSMSGNVGPSNLNSQEDSRAESDTSLGDEEKQYEDDFSSMSEKDGHDEEKEDEEEVEEEVEEDIEEDLGDISADDLLNSSASELSDVTKDQSLSQASSAPAYQEDL